VKRRVAVHVPVLFVALAAALGCSAPAPRPSAVASRVGSSTWRPFTDSSPWNTPIPQDAKLAPDSAALVADLAHSSKWPFFTINIEQYGIPVYWVDERTPRQRVTVTTVGGQGFDKGLAEVPIPAGAVPAVGTDKHLCIVDKAKGVEWGFWEADKQATGWTCSVCAMSDLGGSGVRPPSARDPWWMGHGARACGFPLLAGLVTVDELRAGAIEHALVLAYPHIRSRYYMAPASTAQATTNEALPTRGIPCGGRVQLDPALDLDRMGLSRSGRAIARALQIYGAYIGDFSGAVSLYADASPTAQAAYKAGLLDTYEIKERIGLDKLRVLSLGSLFDQKN
jgi:hypothetical protein